MTRIALFQMTTGIDPAATEAWLRARVPDLAAPVTTELAAGGHSNLTFRITDAHGRKFALRRPPTGTLPPGAHDVLREHRILSAWPTSERRRRFSGISFRPG